MQERSGPQTVHPGDLARGVAAAPSAGASAPVRVATAGTATEARAIFDQFCTPYATNNARAQAVASSGRFGASRLGRLPVATFRDQVFVFYPLRGGAAQLGLSGNARGEEFCVTVDGTATGNELNVLGPQG